MAKTDWQMGDTVQPEDMNQIGQEINDAHSLASDAKDTAENHASRHAVGGDDPLTPEQIGAETPAGAQAKANAAESAAKSYTDSKIASLPAPPVTSVNGKTGAVLLGKGDVGLGNVDNVKQATKTEFDAHANNTNNPHNVTKSQVGLGSVQNYGIASQAQAEAGTANNVYMTPLRTKQAIDAQTGGVQWRINNGKVEYHDGSGWKRMGGIKSVQRGRTTVSSSNSYEIDVSISPVDINKSYIVIPQIFGRATTNSSYSGVHYVYVDLINSTTLRFKGHSTGGDSLGVSWQVIESY